MKTTVRSLDTYTDLFLRRKIGVVTTSGQPPLSSADSDRQYGTNDINLERRIIVENRRQQRMEQTGAQPSWIRSHLDLVLGVGFLVLMAVGIWLLATA